MKESIYKLGIFVALLMSALSLKALTIEQADSLYSSTNYTEALKAYKQIMEVEGSNAELLYNLGNAYYRVGDIPHAILNYERSLRLDPTNEKTKANLEYVNSKTIDNPGVRFRFWETMTNSLALFFKANTWAWMALILFILTIGFIGMYIFGPQVRLRKYGFFGAIVLFILFVITIFTAFRAKYLSERNDEAIVTAKSTILSTSPRAPMNRDEEAMLLHEGIKVLLNDSVAVINDSARVVWYDVSIDTDHRAWINGNDIEKI